MKIFEGLEIKPMAVPVPVDEAALLENIGSLNTEVVASEESEEVEEYLDAA